MSMMVTDSNLQLLPFMTHPWQPDISPCAHALARWKPIPGSHNVLAFVEGSADPKKYAGTLFCPGDGQKASARPIPASATHATLSAAFTPSQEALEYGNVIETDLILVKGKKKYNGSGERHIASGQIDVGNWSDTGLRAGRLQAGRLLTAVWNYALTPEALTVLSYADGIFQGVIPENIGTQPATDCDWDEGAYIQIQMGSLSSGGDWAVRFGEISLKWF